MAQERLPNPARVLSFGCSTGEELLTIRRYFPDAEILGCDIELTAARARDDLPGRVFFSTPETVTGNGPYDIIFANSVLCLHDKQHRRPDIFPFSEFHDLVGILHRSLTAGGLLCAYNTSYLFSELPFSGQYRPIRSNVITDNGFLPKWHSTGVQLSRRKGRRHIVLQPYLTSKWDFYDCIFEKAQGTPITVELAEQFDAGRNIRPPYAPLWRQVIGAWRLLVGPATVPTRPQSTLTTAGIPHAPAPAQRIVGGTRQGAAKDETSNIAG
ncbi:class I SAM-dependent methyltransferase [Mesorhizobium sp. KR9-304]|uniref:class I SAM-dependent methyltransferase n=1 Tax=Mesorhizobium sp. KR9-304 TaxID=3156614 RepID=UPI0032B4CC4A